MANIMMTDVCNLHCPYCFASEFVNKGKNDISEESFDKAVDFITGDGSNNTVGLIGGEPTVHLHFDYFMRKLIYNEKVSKIMLYTNGILIDRFWDVICHPKTHILINCNSPKDIGEKQYAILLKNLDTLFNQKMCGDRVTLGINMYNSHFEYDYMLDLLKKFERRYVRFSITVPNIDEDRNVDAHLYFIMMKPKMLEFFHDLLNEGIIPNFDCNKIPSCLIDENEIHEFDKYLNNEFIKKNIGKSNIINSEVKCRPVIDIRQDLTAVRCFGLSGTTKQKIFDYEGIGELENYYIRTVDAYAYNTSYSPKCNKCHLRAVMKCTGGCLAYKIRQINQIKEYADQVVQNII